MIDLFKIKAAAMAATPGPWYEETLSFRAHIIPEDARHIATMDPQTTLALVEALEAVRKHADRFVASYGNDRTSTGRRRDKEELRAILAEYGIERGDNCEGVQDETQTKP